MSTSNLCPIVSEAAVLGTSPRHVRCLATMAALYRSRSSQQCEPMLSPPPQLATQPICSPSSIRLILRYFLPTSPASIGQEPYDCVIPIYNRLL